MLFSRAFEVLSADNTGHGSIRANLQDDYGKQWTLVASDAQAKAILNNITGRIFGTIRVEQFKDSSFSLELGSVAVLRAGKNMAPREYRRKTVWPDLPVELAKLTNGIVSEAA